MSVARLRLVLAAGAFSAVVAGLGAAAAAATGDPAPSAVLLSPTGGSDTTFAWSYADHGSGGSVPSTPEVAFCDEEALDHAELASQSWTRLDDGTAVTGEFSVTFDQAYGIDPAGLLLRTDDGVTTAPGPGPCPAPR
ncbi:MAG: hypothetical protein ACRD0O_05805, partial [Acidimicrobiia bacterium]